MEFITQVTGMTCGHCVARVKNTIETSTAVVVKEIEISGGRMVLESAEQPDLKLINELLAEVGAYSVEAQHA